MKSFLRNLRSIATHPKCGIKPAGKAAVGFGMKSRSQDAEGFIQPSAVMASRKHRTQLYRFLSTLSLRAGKLLLLPLIGTAVYNISTPLAAHALTSGVTITSITPFAALDSNNSCATGPRAMYLQVNVQNTTAATLTGLSANINTFSNNAFTLDAGESPVRYIGSLAAGQTTALYWYVNYPCQSGGFPQSKLGLTSNYTVTLSDSSPGTVTSSTLTLTTRSEISANAGGDIAGALIGAGAVPGQIIPYTVNYSFGNPANNATVMIQPAGNISFDSSCYRLINTDITVSNFTAGPTTTNNNRLYFTGVAGGPNNALTVVYSFRSLCTSAGTVAKPFADQTSGSDQKYTGNYETFIGPTFPTSTNPFTITKSVSSKRLPTGGSVTYTVTISNPSPYSAVLDRITDILPTGVTYGALVTGTGNTSNTITSGSSSQPATGATGTISWVGNPSTSFSLPAGGSTTLKYTATVPNAVGSYPNSVTATAGSSTTAPATVTVTVGPPANILVVKRITEVQGNRTTNPSDGVTPLNTVVDDTTSIHATDDNNPNWKTSPVYLVGAIDGGKANAGDLVEYTTYFLNAGGANASNVRICERLRPNQTFKTGAYGTGRDVELWLGTTGTDTVQYLTSASDAADRTQLYAPGATLPTGCNVTGTDGGTLVLDLTGAAGTGNPAITNIPFATGKGTPANSYGFFRYKAIVKP